MSKWNEIDWTFQKEEGYLPVWVSVDLIEEKWRLDTVDYIGTGGIGAAIGNRYELVGAWLAEHSYIWTPIMCLDENRAPCFTDGRHRFAWARDHKAVALRVTVSLEESEEFASLYGSSLQLSSWLAL